MKQHQPKEIQLIQSLQNHENTAFSALYTTYQNYFCRWAKKQFPLLGAEKIEDIFQNALIVFIEKFIYTGRVRVEHGRVIGLSASVLSFLTTIGRNMILTEINKAKRMPISSLEQQFHLVDTAADVPQEFQEMRLQLVRKAFEQLKEKEKEVLYFKYVMGYSYEEIRVLMELESADSLKTLGARYMKKFRKHFKRLSAEAELVTAY